VLTGGLATLCGVHPSRPDERIGHSVFDDCVLLRGPHPFVRVAPLRADRAMLPDVGTSRRLSRLGDRALLAKSIGGLGVGFSVGLGGGLDPDGGELFERVVLVIVVADDA